MKNTVHVLVAFVGMLLLSSVPMSGQDSPYGYHEAGTRAILEDHDPLLLYGSVPDLDATHDALLVIAPQLPYDDEEVSRIRQFLDAGGHVMIADDTGTGRDLLGRLDRGLQISGVPVITPVAVGAEPYLFPTGVLAGLDEPFLWPSPAIVDGNGVPLLTSSSLAWRDLDGDGRADLGEPQGEWAFAMTQVGPGRLTVVGDPDLLVRGPVGQALLDWHMDGRALVLDEGHRPQLDPVGMAPLLAGEASAVIGIGSVVVAAAVALRGIRIRRIRRRVRPKESDPRSRAILEELS